MQNIKHVCDMEDGTQIFMIVMILNMDESDQFYQNDETNMKIMLRCF
jgi:hypothetical protein